MAEKEDDNARSVYLVAVFFGGPYKGRLFEFKIGQGGEVMNIIEKGGPDEPPLLNPVASFFYYDPTLPPSHLLCARFCGSSKLYLMLDAGVYPPWTLLPEMKPHSLDGITYDSETKSWGSFRRPIEYKPQGPIVSAYGKLYYLADPVCYPQIPTTSFERYDPTTNSWERLPPFPFYDRDFTSMEIVGYAVFRGYIFFSLGFKVYTFVAFNISRRQWHEVEGFGSYRGYVDYRIMGRAVVIGDTVYAVCDCLGNVITLSFKMESNGAGHDCISVYHTVLSGLEIQPPPSPLRSIRSVSMAHLGNMEFCIFQTGFNDKSNDRQHLCITTFQIVVEEGIGMHIKTLHSTVCDLYLPSCYNAYIGFSFSPDCQDNESEKEWSSNKSLYSSEDIESEREGPLKMSLDSVEEDETMVTGIEEGVMTEIKRAKQLLKCTGSKKRKFAKQERARASSYMEYKLADEQDETSGKLT